MLTLLLGTLLFLTASTLTGYWLARRHGPDVPEWIANLQARNRAWWAMIAVFGFAVWLGAWAVTTLFIFVSFNALREFATLAPSRPSDHRALIWSFFVFLPLQYGLILYGWYGLYSILIPVYAFLLLPCFTAFSGDCSHFLDRVARVQWGIMLCVYCISHIPALLLLPLPDGMGMGLVVFLIAVVQASDVFQYICGKALGRHKLAPAISPSKTVEGLVGGITLATLLGGALSFLGPFNLWQGLIIALLISVAGFCGGFVLSAIKRDRQVKDWGTFIQGHGGMLDRVDSLCFAAPIFFHVIRYWWT
ncbi:hypothetical protein HMPREF0326_02116 [Desulfovibrio sp. 3_1_syn3]|uniref:phosphatidate cytidylyltransferase n=1 Tax=Desulfovibrio sp. 3_1_syn3 TaxID=457398 RepID=UPI0001E12AD6|nr:phosphatidate cytidylyltransferase [Desulfovibrio sp. 3_1_syn3]EFL85364.1 hypothetical protein HMPREF0326_02116 [Desulfovibrio sp. 3_1_syn3]